MDTKALRQKILDLAIRGKLVPQDPNDEPASVLLERIRAEKEQMVKDGKLKAKDIKNDTIIFKGDDNLHYEQFADGTVKCIEDEIPFELPDGWAWARLGNIGEIITGGTPSKSHHEYYGNAFPFFKPADLDQGRKTIISSEYLSEKGKSCCRIIPKFSTAVCCIGSIGKCGYLNVEGTTNQQINSIIPNIDSLYVYYYCSSDCFSEHLLSLASATTIAIVNKSKLESVFIPVPPMVEQKRIANTLDTALELIETLEVEKSDILVAINNVKYKILDLAIRGKLVPQDPNDEPASVLLERIRAEKEELLKQGKIKRDKKESVIFKGEDNSYYEKIGDEITCIDDELPFEIPDSWCWARLNCISINYDSYRKPVNSYDRKNRVLGKSKDELYPYYGATGQIGFIDDFLFNGEYILLGEDAAPFLDKKAQKAYMIKGKSWVNNHAHILQSLVFPEYLTNCLNSIDYFNYVYGTTRLKLTQENMNRILVPVPSIKEQRKIAQAINNLFVLIESIKASLS